jgi:xanthosine utilization system XapX-like protein
MGQIFMVDFLEERAEFKGFNRYYNAEILPLLQEKENERQKLVSKAYKIGFGIGIVGLVIAAIIVSRGAPPFAFFIVAAIGAIGGLIGSTAVLGGMQKQVKQHLMEHICHFLKWDFIAKEFDAPAIDVWQKNKLLPRHDRVKFEDQMRGEVHGANFTFCEAHLETRHTDSKGRTHWSTSFRGVLLEIDFHKDFYGRTIVLKDAGMFNAKKRKDMKRVGLEDPVFEKMFEAYSTDQVEARTLLTPPFMQRLVDLKNQVSGKNIQFGFWERKLFIAVVAPNQFEAGSMFKPLVDQKRIQKILDEIGAIHDVIDGVLKPLKKHTYS